MIESVSGSYTVYDIPYIISYAVYDSYGLYGSSEFLQRSMMGLVISSVVD